MASIFITNEEEKKLNEEISKIKKTCSNCADLIVCYQGEEPTEEEELKAITCEDYVPDFNSFQDAWDEAFEK